MLTGTIEVANNPALGLPAHTLTWTLEEEVPAPKYDTYVLPNIRTKTQAEEVWVTVQAFYEAKGEGVPPEEAKACLADIKKEKEEQKKCWALFGTGIPDAEYYAMVPPAYGTPEFWKAYHAKKRASTSAK